MDALISTFHIDVKLILAQMLNFLIVFLVLWFFALKPLVKIMTKRTGKIEKSLEDAKKIAENLKSSEVDYLAKIIEAKKEADEILTKAHQNAENKKKEMVAKTKEEIEKIALEAKKQIHQEKDQILDDARQEIVGLIILSLEKILQKSISEKIDQELVEKTLADINFNSH